MTAAPVARRWAPAALSAAGLLAAVAALWRAEVLLGTSMSDPLEMLVLPVLVGGGLLVLGQAAPLLAGSELAARATLPLPAPGTPSREFALQDALPAIRRACGGLGWMVLALGMLAWLAGLPESISALEWTGDAAAAGRYLGALGSLAVAGSLVMTPLILANAVAAIFPDVGKVVGFPWMQLAVFGAGFLVLGRDGALAAAFAIDGSWALAALCLALALSYAAAALDRAMAHWPGRFGPGLRNLVLAARLAWPLAMAFAVLALARITASRPNEGLPGAVDASYLGVLDSLPATQVALALLAFYLLHGGRALRPDLCRLLPAPIGWLALLAAAYVLLSDEGVIATAYSVPVSGLLAALSGVAGLTYAAAIARNAAEFDFQGIHAQRARLACRALGPAAAAAAIALLAWSLLDHLPVGSVVLLERPETQGVISDLLPVVAGFYESRFAIAGVTFATVAASLVVRSRRGSFARRHRAVLQALNETAAGCLIWLIAAGLAQFGHGFPLAGAILASGLITLAIARLAAHAAAGAGPVAAIAGWISASRIRAFTLGAAAAVYILLLRPVFYEVVELAALYEYGALLLLLLVGLLSLLLRLRAVSGAADRAGPSPPEWSHHRQIEENKVDRRAAFAATMRRRYLELGDWRPLWEHLLALLYRNGCSIDEAVAVCRALRTGAATPLYWAILGGRRRASARATALDLALDLADEALADSAKRLGDLRRGDLQTLSSGYVAGGEDPTPLAVGLILASCQRGLGPQAAARRWGGLLDSPPSGFGRLRLPWFRAAGRPRNEPGRRQLADAAIESLFADGPVPHALGRS